MALSAPSHPLLRSAPSPPSCDITAETRLLAALADAPAVARGWVLASPCPTPGPATLLVEWAQRDCATNRQRRYLTSHGLGRGDPSALPPPPPP